jgi:hypothetical protein
MDPAEEVLLDPLLVNPVCLTRGKESYSYANRSFKASGGGRAERWRAEC